jgi:hypothetical protein
MTKYDQTRMMEKYSLHVFRNISESLYIHFGMRIAILAGFQDRQGDSQVVLYA